MAGSTSAYCKVTRNMVDNLINDFTEIRKEMKEGFRRLEETNQTLYNHLSSRSLPSDTRLIKLLIGIMSAVIGFAGTLILKVWV